MQLSPIHGPPLTASTLEFERRIKSLWACRWPENRQSPTCLEHLSCPRYHARLQLLMVLTTEWEREVRNWVKCYKNEAWEPLGVCLNQKSSGWGRFSRGGDTWAESWRVCQPGESMACTQAEGAKRARPWKARGHACLIHCSSSTWLEN